MLKRHPELSSSAAALAQTCSQKESALHPLVIKASQTVIRDIVTKHNLTPETDLRITYAVDAAESGEDGTGKLSVFAHVELLPPIPSCPVIVEMRGEPRKNALVKDLAWVQ